MQYSIDIDNRRSNQHVWDVADLTGCHKFRLHDPSPYIEQEAVIAVELQSRTENQIHLSLR